MEIYTVILIKFIRKNNFLKICIDNLNEKIYIKCSEQIFE